MRSLSRWIPILGGAIAGAVIALVIAGTGGGTSRSVTTVLQRSSPASEPAAFSSSGGMTINQIYRAASPGVVDIHVISQTQSQTPNLFGGGGTQQQLGEGAGVVYDTQGDILTDEHVVANATSVKVSFQGGGPTVAAKVLGTDPSTDVAVIHVNVPASQLHPIPFANSSTAQVGDPVVAIGSPFGLPETTTAGIVSQTGRSIQAPNGFQITGAIQTDAAINPGNSGGPLLDANAHVLGLNDQIETNNTTTGGEGSSSGVGFATPGNEDQKVANTIISGKKVEHSYVGVSLAQSSVGGAKIAASPVTGQNGQTEEPIAPGSPAAKAGLEPGDLITAIDGKTVSSTDQFIATISGEPPGQAITLTVKRDGATHEIQVTLGVRPAQAPGG